MPDALPLVLTDVAIRGALLALLALLALATHRDRPRWAAARVGGALCLGLCVQVVSAPHRCSKIRCRVCGRRRW